MLIYTCCVCCNIVLMLQTNVGGTFNVITKAVMLMNENEAMNPDESRGCIINTSSIAAFEGQIGELLLNNA